MNIKDDQEFDIWAPNVVGPLDRCIRCFTLHSDDSAFCGWCGKISTVFKTKFDTTNVFCHAHNRRGAVAYCCLCQKPICNDCVEKEHWSFAAGDQLFQCKSCLLKSQELEESFKRNLRTGEFCPKHREVKAVFLCSACGIPSCPYCSYFVDAGWLRKKLGDGPFCLSCFRTATQKRQRKAWISGREAIQRRLIMPSKIA